MVAQTYSPAWWLPGRMREPCGAASSGVRRRSGRASSDGTPTMEISSIWCVSMLAPGGRISCFFTDWREHHGRTMPAGCFWKLHVADGRPICCSFAVAARSSTALRDSITLVKPVTSMLSRVDCSTADHEAPFVFAGVSLGGNVLLKWLGELGESAASRVIAAAAVSVPFDLARASRHIGHGFARVYQRHFLQSLRRKALAKLDRYPDLVPRERIESARTLFDFDDAVTAPVHGFARCGRLLLSFELDSIPLRIFVCERCCSARLTIRFFRVMC